MYLWVIYRMHQRYGYEGYMRLALDPTCNPDERVTHWRRAYRLSAARAIRREHYVYRPDFNLAV